MNKVKKYWRFTIKEEFIPADKQNFDKRQRFIVFHYTVLDEKDSIETLTRGGVGAHFLIPKQALKDDESGEQFDYYKLVDIKDRAWHAGVSYWQNRSGLNDTSIGIEIVNYGYGLVQESGDVLFTYQIENQLKEFIIQTLQKQDESSYQLLNKENLLSTFLSDMTRGLVPPPDRETYKEKISQDLINKYRQLTEEWRKENDKFLDIKQEDLFQLEKDKKLVWDEYTEHQLDTIEKLIKEKIEPELTIKDETSEKVYYEIAPQFIIGHMAIALGRKTDPGPRLFIELAKRGIGAWPDEVLVSTIEQQIKMDQGVDYQWIQDNLKRYGYKVDSTGQLDTQTKDAIRAFQMQFEPENYSGEPSVKTISVLEALIKKYYPNQASNYPVLL